jgi:SIS domain
MTAVVYLRRIQELIENLAHHTDQIERAAAICADCIASGNVVHVFGAGHSRMAAEEAYPRIGAWSASTRSSSWRLPTSMTSPAQMAFVRPCFLSVSLVTAL